MKRKIEVSVYDNPATGLIALRLMDSQSGTKMQTSAEALLDLLTRMMDGEFDELLRSTECQMQSP